MALDDPAPRIDASKFSAFICEELAHVLRGSIYCVKGLQERGDWVALCEFTTQAKAHEVLDGYRRQARQHAPRPTAQTLDAVRRARNFLIDAEFAVPGSQTERAANIIRELLKEVQCNSSNQS